MTHSSLLLASASPRRRELLERMGLAFNVRVSAVDESLIPADHPRTFALRAAYAKAVDVAKNAPEDTLVLGADTVVALGLRLFGKPRDEYDARRMMRALSGQTHQVITGVALARAGAADVLVDSATTDVTFRQLSDNCIDDYVGSASIYDKAGGYAIQEQAGAFIEALRGDYWNVVGLPCRVVLNLLGNHWDTSRFDVPMPPEPWQAYAER